MTAREKGVAGYDDEYGYGIVDARAGVEYATMHDLVRTGGSYTQFIETMGEHTRIFKDFPNGNLASGAYVGVRQYSARRFIDFSDYNFYELPDILVRNRRVMGWSSASPNGETPWVGVVPGTLTLAGCWIETYAYTGVNSNAQNIGWFPCLNPKCENAPDIDMQVTIAGKFGLLAPLALAGEGFDALQHKQRVKLGWADQNNFEDGWIIQRKVSGAGAPWMVIASIPANSSSGVIYYDATVQGKTTYHYRVRPYRENNPQFAFSPEVIVTTPTFWPDNATALVTAIIGTCAGGGTEPLGFESGFIEQSSFGGGGEVDPELLAYTDEITVSWSPPANQNPFFPISHYIVQRLDQTFPFESGPIWDNITGTSITICNNPLNQSFPFKLWSVDFDGDTSMSFTTPATPAGCLPICEELPPAKTTTENSLLPYSTELMGNYPNPFNPSTTIKFSLATRDHVSLTVYNILGQEVVKLVNGERNRGENSVFWNGRDSSGVSVSSGIYFYRFVTGDVVQSRKMLLVK